MYYIFVINNIELGESVWKAQDIMKYLLGEKLWAFSMNAPNLKHIDEDDRVLVYLAGKGNRVFAAEFTIAGKPHETKPQQEEPDWLGMFPVRVHIKEINPFPNKVPISEIIADLDFIKDKKNYGLYFRQSTRIIEKDEFMKIVSSHMSEKGV